MGNVYLNDLTREKIYTRCGLEFGPEMVGPISKTVAGELAGDSSRSVGSDHGAEVEQDCTESYGTEVRGSFKARHSLRVMCQC